MGKSNVAGMTCPECGSNDVFTTDKWGIFHIKFIAGGAHLECNDCGYVENW